MASIELRMNTKKAADFVRLIELYSTMPHSLMATSLAHQIATTLVGMHTLSDDAPGTMYLSALVHEELRRGQVDDDDLCDGCGGPLDDGEGYDGLCGTCADRAEAEGKFDGHT